MKKIILFCFVLAVLSGCWPMSQGRVMRSYDCYDGQDTGIESLLNINGYYVLPCWGPLKYKKKILFYKNGTFVYVLAPYDNSENPDISAFFREIIENQGGKHAEYWKEPTIGRYTVNGDTIKIQYRTTAGAYYWDDAVFEYFFKVIDNQTMQYLNLNIKRRSKEMQEDSRRYLEKCKDSSVYFVPLDTILSIDHHRWLKDSRFKRKN